MEQNQIYHKLNEIFEEIIDEVIELRPENTADDVEGWDSLSHIQIIVSIEKIFNIKFTTQEIQSFENVKQLVDSIQSKLG